MNNQDKLPKKRHKSSKRLDRPSPPPPPPETTEPTNISISEENVRQPLEQRQEIETKQDEENLTQQKTTGSDQESPSVQLESQSVPNKKSKFSVETSLNTQNNSDNSQGGKEEGTRSRKNSMNYPRQHEDTSSSLSRRKSSKKVKPLDYELISKELISGLAEAEEQSRKVKQLQFSQEKASGRQGSRDASKPRENGGSTVSKNHGHEWEPGQILRPQEISQEPAPEIAVTSHGKKVAYHPLTNLPGVYQVESVDPVSPPESTMRLDLKKKIKKSIAAGKILNAFKKVKEKEKEDLKQLKEFNVPGQKTLLNVLLEDDHYMHNFNGFIREYYSHVLRSYCLMNMQGRYRGLQPNSTCLTMIDISRLTSKEVTQEKQQREYAQGREAMLDKLEAVALDPIHFQYLKELANNQPLILPISIMHGILIETTPAVKNVWTFYRSHLGKNHECTKQAGQHYIHLEKRGEMYEKLGFGDNIITEETI